MGEGEGWLLSARVRTSIVEEVTEVKRARQERVEGLDSERGAGEIGLLEDDRLIVKPMVTLSCRSQGASRTKFRLEAISVTEVTLTASASTPSLALFKGRQKARRSSGMGPRKEEK